MRWQHPRWFYVLAWMAIAMARKEGYYNARYEVQPHVIAARHNNPGNLRSWGSRPVQQGFAVFPTITAGWLAMMSQLALNISRNLTLMEMIGGKPGVYGGWAPASDNNNPQAYASLVRDVVLEETGVDLRVGTLQQTFQSLGYTGWPRWK